MSSYRVEQGEDAELVRRAVRGDERAFTALVDRFYPQCLRYALRVLGDRADAEEVVQDTFVRVHRALAGYEERQRFEAWLYRILLNCCRTRLASRRRHEVVAPAEALDRLAAPVSPWSEGWEAEVQQLLARLPDRQREAFLLHYVEGLSYDEMSTATGEGMSTLKMRVKRAKDRLMTLLRESDHV